MMSLKRYIPTLLMALFMVVLLVDPSYADASSAGGQLKDTFLNIVTGNLGLVVGLAIAFLGLWTWIVGQEAFAGIIMIIGGILLTMLPGIFKGFRGMVAPVVDEFSTGDKGASSNRGGVDAK